MGVDGLCRYGGGKLEKFLMASTFSLKLEIKLPAEFEEVNYREEHLRKIEYDILTVENRRKR